MGDLIWTYSNQLWFNITSWILVGVCALGICLRLYVRVHVRGGLLSWRAWRWSDILLVIAWFGFMVGSTLQLVAYARYGYVSSVWEIIAANQPRYAIVRKILLAWTTTFWIWLFAVKASLLCFYNELIDKYQHPKMWWVIRIVGVLLGALVIVIVVYGITWCLPIEHNWGYGWDLCWAFFDSKFKYNLFRQLAHAITDIMIMLIPLPLVPQLRRLPIRQTLGVLIMVVLGFFCTVCSLIYLVASVQRWDDGNVTPSHAATRFLEFEPVIELGAAILIQCVPSLKAFVILTRKKDDDTLVASASRASGTGKSKSKTMTEVIADIECTVDEDYEKHLSIPPAAVAAIGRIGVIPDVPSNDMIREQFAKAERSAV